MPDATSNGTRIHWDEMGAGEPLLLIMGLGYSREMWHRSRPILSERYRTIAFDNRGVGKSDVPVGAYTMAQMAADAVVVLDAAGVDRADVFGVSMGGMIAQELAIANPGRVRSLVLGCTACGGRTAAPAAENVRQIVTNRASMTPEEAFRSMAPYIYDAGTPQERIDEDFAMRMRSFPKPEGYLGQLQAILAWTAADRLQQIDCPTLIVHGNSDQLVPPENAYILQKLIRGSMVAMLQHASHLFTTDQPEAAHREILGFLDNRRN
jgi:pimeloyl-ACP methyl ester carboxylesterase